MVAIRKIHSKKTPVFLYLHAAGWFTLGAILGFFFLISSIYFIFQAIYANSVFPGVSIAGVNFGGRSESFVENYFNQKNAKIAASEFTFSGDDSYATLSAKQLQFGYNSQLLANQAISVGKSNDIFSNITLVFQAYLSGITLSPSYAFSNNILQASLDPIERAVHMDPIDAQFQFDGQRVSTFKPSSNGQDIDFTQLDEEMSQRIPILLAIGKTQNVQLTLPIKTIYPKVTTQQANNLGISDLIGTGTSLFQYSIPSRIYNVELAASRLNGIIVAPGEEFSFDKALGDVSAYTGYQQAYVIQNGHTVLGDGGGVCQVSTTMFRAILNAGLPITERHAHDYRVEYYEEDGPPGIDATVYVPTVDLKFVNTTGHAILIQTAVDPSVLRLTFYLYGVKDGRQVNMTTPIVSNVIPAPAPLYQDDPSIPKGKTQQTDFAANGATVTFTRVVTQNGKQIINENYVSNYRPWQAVYLVGTGG